MPLFHSSLTPQYVTDVSLHAASLSARVPMVRARRILYGAAGLRVRVHDQGFSEGFPRLFGPSDDDRLRVYWLHLDRLISRERLPFPPVSSSDRVRLISGVHPRHHDSEHRAQYFSCLFNAARDKACFREEACCAFESFLVRG